MPLIVETGAGTPGANSYVTAQYITTYLTDRNRLSENGWGTAVAPAQDAAAIAGTQYLETRFGPRIKGRPLLDWIEGRKSEGTLALSANPLENELVTLGAVTYRFVTALGLENDVELGADAAESLTRLAAAITMGGAAEGVHEDTRVNYEATAGVSGSTFTCTARNAGESGDDIAFATTVTGSTISGSDTLTGGIDAGPQPLSFPRAQLRDRHGALVVGVPANVKMATAEYSVRALVAKLDPDPSTDARSSPVLIDRKKFGPFEKKVQYARGAPLVLDREYPEADRLLAEYLRPSGRVYR